jgi:uncharacterized membrane protein
MVNSTATLSSMRRNVQEICKMEHEALRKRSPAERFGDLIAQQSGRIWFIGLHALWFGAWIFVNSGKFPKVRPVDAFPYPFLTLEAIFLSLFIWMSQNRASLQADRRAHLDLQINLLAEHESTKTLELLQALCQYHGLSCAKDPELKELISQTRPEEILQELKDSLPTTGGEHEPPTVSLT